MNMNPLFDQEQVVRVEGLSPSPRRFHEDKSLRIKIDLNENSNYKQPNSNNKEEFFLALKEENEK